MKCPICSSKRNSKIFVATNIHGRISYSKHKFNILKCKDCECVYPEVKVNSKFYSQYYPKVYQRPSPLLEKIWINFNLYIKNRLLSQKGTLLDVGCGKGEFLMSLPKSIKGFGIDLQPQKITGAKFIKDDFLKHEFKTKFDVITFCHSLEHFSNAKKVINKAIKILNRNGKILIFIPNTNSLAFRYGQKYWFHLDSPRHLFLPNNQNIQKLFPQNTKISISYTPLEFPLDLYWSLKNKPILRAIYPIIKLFDHETMLVIAESMPLPTSKLQ